MNKKTLGEEFILNNEPKEDIKQDVINLNKKN
jgi:hypothetical protein